MTYGVDLDKVYGTTIVPGYKGRFEGGRTSVFPVFDRYTSPCAVMRGTSRGKQKGAGALPEMASGTLPLLRRFGSRRDELITREECVHQGERGENAQGFTATSIR